MKSILNQIAQYLFLQKKDASKPDNINIKLMHGMNRISIVVFLVAAIIIALRLFSK